MDSKNITVINGVVNKISDQEVSAAEVRLGTKFPEGYRDFITKFGEGAMTEIRIYSPDRILNGLNNVEEWRRRINEYWFWESGVISKSKALECIIIADTFDGDELVFHPQNPETVYFFPRHDDQIYEVPGGFKAVCFASV